MRRRTTATPRMSAGARRESILNTTIGCIAQFGFWGFTIRDVAQAEGITEAGLLYHFKGKEDLLAETLKYADHVNQIAIAERLGVEGVTGDVLADGIAYHCDHGLKTILAATVETNAARPELVRLYALLESEALSADHPVHAYFKERETNLLREYAFAAARDGVADPERTALQALSAMEGLQLRWLNDANDIDFVAEWSALADLIIP
ncbi:TetR/AcrR family transcriptional regulator [Bifidobacterium samirii]|uniref:TetR family transcriptional regulator n=1 Tax=Bifidobacterium samirii TaxID=2306974 RepID=A0A430FWI9_9BIFI|nr:TetR/AcrR family transcriptional regulator [Bifidobacterium samirii]RSX58737.1 TetR family transcriptional regulator [Bifidobacterium samirii]